MADHRDAHIRHAHYYKTILSQADDLYCRGGESADESRKLLDDELKNIRCGQGCSQKQMESDKSMAELCRDYAMHGANLLNLHFHPNEQIEWGEAALESARRLQDQASEAAILSNLGMALEDLGNLSRSLEYQQQALGIAQAVGDRFTEETTLGNLGSHIKPSLGTTTPSSVMNVNSSLLRRLAIAAVKQMH
jgi:tetratricopeptide (TPR) repeat protein